MNPDEINKRYWSAVDSGKMLAGLCYPGEELIANIAPWASILDVGCGNGKISEYLSDKGYSVTGIDINKKTLMENAERNSSIRYREADVTDPLPFEDAFFDAIVIPYVFVSIIDKTKEEAAAKELARVLKPGGFLWVCEATYSKDYEERYKQGKAATGLDNTALSYSKNPANPEKIERVIRHYSEQELDSLFGSLHKIYCRQAAVVSPSSGMTVETIIGVYKKA